MVKAIFEIFRSGFVKVISSLNAIASFWIFMLMLLMTCDVLGRVLLNQPVTGTPEIVRVSIVGIVFLQIPHTFWANRQVRAEIILKRLSPMSKEVVQLFTYILGTAFFVGNCYASWGYTVTSWQILEYVGEGALRVPVYPIRTIILLGSALVTIIFTIWSIRSIKSIRRIMFERER